MNILDFPAMKARKEKISMVTCYDYWSAELLEKTDIDMLLVGTVWPWLCMDSPVPFTPRLS